MRWLCASFLILSLPLAAPSQSQSVRIGVLGIFHAHQLTLSPVQDEGLLVTAGGQQIFLRPLSACRVLRVRSSANFLNLTCGGREMRVPELRASGRNQQAASLVLAIPGKIQRRYEGILTLKAKEGELIPVIEMDLETAVAAVVQAETDPGTPREAMKAQAVVSRSYLVAGAGRHKDFDFCDLTHCQLLREPSVPGSPAANAAAATRGMVLTFKGKPFAAMFTRSCGGHTRTPQEIGLTHAEYPYFSVLCEFCYKSPVRWTRKISSKDAALLFLRRENGRLAIGHKLGWDAVPSNNFMAREQNGEVTLQGIGQGHGIGLCQRGARHMAELGSNFHEILAHYFPNTKLENAMPSGRVAAGLGPDF